MGLNYGGHHDFPKDEVLDAVVIDGEGPEFDATDYPELCIQIKAEIITLGADIILHKSLDDGVSFIPIAQIDKATVAASGDKTHEFKIFDEPKGIYKLEIDNRADGTYTGTARAAR